MIKHIVMWRLKDNAHGNDSMTNAIRIKDKLEALRDTIPGIAALEVGIDYSRSDSSSDVLLWMSRNFPGVWLMERLMKRP